MRIRNLALAALLLAGLPGQARAATIVVQPGEGAIQAALDQAEDGDTIVLTAGTYSGGNTRSGIDNLRILGRGEVIVDAGGQGAAFTFSNVHRLRIENVTMRNVSDGVYIDDQASSDITLRRCTVDTASDTGIEVYGVDGVTVDRCTFVNCRYPVYLDHEGADASDRAVVTRCTMTGIGHTGILVGGSSARISRNTLSAPAEQARYGIHLQAGEYVGCRLDRNTVTGVDTAIRVGGADHVLLRNQTASGVYLGFEVAGGGGHKLTRNTATGFGLTGFYVSSSGNTFTRNAVTGTPDGAAQLQSEVPESENTYVKNRFTFSLVEPD